MKTKEQILTNDLRGILKRVMQKEIQKLPETLEALEPKERINVVCKLMPYVFPKVEAIITKDGEPFPMANDKFPNDLGFIKLSSDAKTSHFPDPVR